MAKTKEKYSVDVDPKIASKASMLSATKTGRCRFHRQTRWQWSFDTKAGRDEICCDASARTSWMRWKSAAVLWKPDTSMPRKRRRRQGQRVREKIISTPGKKGWPGLAKPRTAPGEVRLGEEIAKALEQGYSDKAKPFHGYYFKVMKGQGPAAPMGEMDFVVGGAMIGGFALTAAPAEYKVTGVRPSW